MLGGGRYKESIIIYGWPLLSTCSLDRTLDPTQKLVKIVLDVDIRIEEIVAEGR
jgi:hypothetical protein